MDKNAFKIKLTNLLKFCADIIYPNRCPCCRNFIMWNEYICSDCIKAMTIDQNDICEGCGKNYKDCLCDSFPEYDKAMALTYYENPAKLGIIRLKRSISKNFGIYAGTELGKMILQRPSWMEADCIAAVPMSPLKKFIRGYNQTDVIVKSISKCTGIPIIKGCIKKKNGYRAQHTLTASERAKNTESFVHCGMDLQGLKIILCDDILTTGNTLNRCASLLKECGADKVYVAVAATTKRKTKVKDNED